jgi:hypothetical protein
VSPVPPQASNIIYQREKNGRRERKEEEEGFLPH